MRSYLDEVDLETIKQRFDAFWEREILDRPLIYITAPKERQKKAEFPTPKSMEERWTNVEYILNKMELYLENTVFLGDAIPGGAPFFLLPNLGPDHFTACLGGNLVFKDEVTSWCLPFVEDLSRYDPVLDKNNKWWKLMNELLDVVCDVAEGNFLVGVPDLQYGAGSLRAALGSQKLIRYFFQEPQEVKRLIKRTTDICTEVFEHYYEKISRIQKGSISWIPAYSRGRYFALQDDFSGLLSPKMFREFIMKEEVERLSKHLDNSFFHLDGPIALENLEPLLEIETLDGINWVPGAGAKPMSEWIDVCTRILNSGKCLEITCRPDEVKFLLSKLKHEGLFISVYCSSEKEARSVLKIAERYHK